MTVAAAAYPSWISAEVEADPYAFYKRLRAEDPLHFDEVTGSYLVTKHADVAAGYRNPAFTTKNYEWQLEPVLGKTVLQFEGQEHARKRALVSPYFRGKGLENWVAPVQRNIAALLDDLVRENLETGLDEIRPGTQVDIMDVFGHYVSVYTMADVLGLPKSDFGSFYGWYKAIIAFHGNHLKDPGIHERGLQATADLRAYLRPYIVARRENPGEDLISALLTAEFEGETLDDEEVLANVSILLVAGSDTTDNTVGNLIKHLLVDRSNYEALLDDRGLVIHAIGETLRVTPPSQSNGRILSEPVEIQGTLLPEGTWVQLIMASANRDEDRFANADVFDMHRTDIDHTKVFQATGEHFAFGFGRHFCLGSQLARTELEIMINALLDRFPRMRLVDGFVPVDRGMKMRAPQEIQVVL